MSYKNRVLYLISRENILQPGVLKSQVIDLAGHIKKEGRGTDVFILNLPSLHSFFKYFRNYRDIKDYAHNLNIRLLIIPILPVGRSIMPVWAIPFFLIQTLPATLFFVVKYRINIINARGYLSALVSYFIKKTGLNIRVVFENHGPYLLEGITHNRWQESDSDYNFWVKLEKHLFDKSDYIVARSQGLLDHTQKISPLTPSLVIPCSVNEKLFAPSVRNRVRKREELGLKEHFVVVYAGSLGSFHSPDFLAETYSLIRKKLPDPYFLIVTHSDPEDLILNLEKKGIGQSEFKVIQNPSNLGEIISVGDAALHVYSDLPVTPYVLAVKFAEYSAAGLPVIVTKNLTSITNVVDESQCGVIVDTFDPKDIQVKMQKLVKERETFKKNALKLAREYFSVRVCAKKYLEIYDELTQKSKS